MAQDRGVSAEPWSVKVRTGEVGRGLTRRLEAGPEVRTRIARVLDLQSLDLLEAEVNVTPAPQGFEVKGVIHAKLAQTCGITLEPLPAEIRSEFTVRCHELEDGEQEPEPSHEVEVDLEGDDPPDSIEDGQIDLGGYVVEHLALELDPFPRKAGVVFEPPAAEAEPSPFAILAELKKEGRD